MKSRLTVAFLCLVLAAPGVLSAQESSSKRPPEPDPPEAGRPYDPYHAEKNLEIGQYYLKKGNYDAAIDRFQQAARLKPNFAKPYLLLGEAYEKKGEKAEALKSYKKYLEILPAAEDAAKVRKRIEKLTRELEHAAARGPSG